MSEGFVHLGVSDARAYRRHDLWLFDYACFLKQGSLQVHGSECMFCRFLLSQIRLYKPKRIAEDTQEPSP